jgi:hypothetical protein
MEFSNLLLLPGKDAVKCVMDNRIINIARIDSWSFAIRGFVCGNWKNRTEVAK